MTTPPIFVNGKPFFGRREEQREFRAQMERALNPPRDEADDPSPFILYLYGDGGMGKSTLLRRFEDIVREEFAQRFTITRLDWEAEMRKNTLLQGDRSRIPASAVLDTLHRVLGEQHPDWRKTLEIYKQGQSQREQVRDRTDTLFRTYDERDPLSSLRDFGSNFLAKFVRGYAEGMGSTVGDEGETALAVITAMGLQKSETELRQLAERAMRRLKDELSDDELNLLLFPNLTMAQWLGEALRKISTPSLVGKRATLLFFLDTYEIVDANDVWLREVMNIAGANTVWVLAGRNDLVRSRQYGKEYFIGYQDVSTRFRGFDMKQMTLGDVRDYFTYAVSERPLEESQAKVIFQATRAIPLAVREAGDLWKRGLPLTEIARGTENLSGKKIVQVMTERYHLHCINNTEDKYALYALALANDDTELLRALLQPDNEPTWQLEDKLRDLERAYASVHRDDAKLHEDAATFFIEYLRDPTRRGDARTVALITRGIQHLQARLAEAEVTLRLIEERHADEGWRDIALKLTDFYFWQSEAAGWRWFAPCYVESRIYSSAMQKGLLDIIQRWRESLDKQGKQRLEKLTSEDFYSFTPNEVNEMLRWREGGWLNGEGQKEHTAILSYMQAQLSYDRKEYDNALRCYELLKGLPEGGMVLRDAVVEGLEHLCNRFNFPEGKQSAVPSPQAVRAGSLGISLNGKPRSLLHSYGIALTKIGQSEKALAYINNYFDLIGEGANTRDYNTLGVVSSDLKRYTEAITAYETAVRLDPDNAAPHHGLGNVYRNLKKYEEAISAYQAAIRLDPTLALPHDGLGNVYHDLKKYEEAISAYQAAIRLDPTDAGPYHGLGNVYGDLKRYEEAMAAYQAAIDLDPTYPYLHHGLGNVYHALRRYEEAMAAYQAAIDLDPTDPYLHHGLGNVYRDLKQYEEAITVYQNAIILSPDAVSYHGCLAACFRATSNIEKYNYHLFIARKSMANESIYSQACIESIAENYDQALILLQRSISDGSCDIEWAKEDPDFEELRDDPRFRALVGMNADEGDTEQK